MIIINSILKDLGFPQEYLERDLPGLPGRISSESHGVFTLLTAAGQRLAQLTGKDRQRLCDTTDYPVTGDYVILDKDDIVRQILPRRSLLTRGDRFSASLVEGLVANVDVVLIVISMNQDFNARKLRRFLITAQSSGADPVLVLTKADLNDDAQQEAYLAAAQAITTCPTIITRQDQPDSVKPILELVSGGRSAVLLGASGVGKSTLINLITGQDLMQTAAIRISDDQGRHTTTNRAIIVIPGIGCLIDTPGLRKIELMDDGEAVSGIFEDITQLTGQCRYTNCSHRSEPGCAIQTAMEGGRLSAADWQDYQAMLKEARLMESKARRREAERTRQAKHSRSKKPRNKKWLDTD